MKKNHKAGSKLYDAMFPIFKEHEEEWLKKGIDYPEAFSFAMNLILSHHYSGYAQMYDIESAHELMDMDCSDWHDGLDISFKCENEDQELEIEKELKKTLA